MKKLVWFALLAACHGSTEPKSPIGTWTLVSVHGANLPFDTALITGGGPYVVAGSLQILASRYYVETEIDSSATCTCILPAATTGGTWSADGGMLSLHDTNTYAPATYTATFSSHMLLVPSFPTMPYAAQTNWGYTR